MAGPLEMAGSIVGIVSFGIQVAKGLVHYGAWKNQDLEVANLCRSLDTLLGTLSLLGNTIEPPAKFDEDVRENVEKNVKVVETAIQELDRELAKFRNSEISTQSARAIMRRHVREDYTRSKNRRCEKSNKLFWMHAQT